LVISSINNGTPSLLWTICYRTSSGNVLPLAKRGKLPKDEVAAIRAGTGKYDMASDVVALVHLYRREAKAIAGFHPFTEAEFTPVLASAMWLLENLTPHGARANKPAPASSADDDFDRLWTMLDDLYGGLRVAGYYLFRDDFDRKTPHLGSRVVKLWRSCRPRALLPRSRPSLLVRLDSSAGANG
jgi:hypothetical protein